MELSNKLRRQFRLHRAKGEFIGSFAAFGYLKSPEDKYRLIVDETAADVVRLIFEDALQVIPARGLRII